MAKVKITLAKSLIGRKKNHILTANSLGLRKIGQSVIKKDNECTRGMVFVVKHLVEVTEA